MIPDFNAEDVLPPGIHLATWEEFEERFGASPYRAAMMAGLKRMAKALKAAGCQMLYVDGSFATAKNEPGDFDACWDETGVDWNVLDQVAPELLVFENQRALQKATYGGEAFPSCFTADCCGSTFLEFFQINKLTGAPKGIVALSL